MKIAVSARGKSLDSAMDPRFGRSAGFVLFDTETGQTDYLDNSDQLDLTQGTGIKSAQMIVAAGTDVLITGQMGPKAAGVLSRAGIKLYACHSGTVQDAIHAVDSNTLEAFRNDAIQSGPGKMGGRGMGGGGRGCGLSQRGKGRGAGLNRN